MQAPSLNRPPRHKRPPEVVRHVNEIMEAFRRMVETRKDVRQAEPRPIESKT